MMPLLGGGGFFAGTAGAVVPLEISGTPVLTATQNAAYAGFTVSATGGTTPYTFSVFSGALPGGITLNSSTGEVSGTPTGSGTFAGIVIRVTDSAAPALTDDLASFTIEVAADPTVPTADIDFVNATYSVNGGAVAAADIVDTPGAIDGTGLVVANGGAVVGIIGGLLSQLTTADFTLVLEYTDDGANGTTYILAVTSGDWSQFVQLQRRDSGSGRTMEAYDEDGGSRFVQDADSHGAGIHTIALTRTAGRLAMSVDGSAVELDATGSFTPALTVAAFGGLPGDFAGNACTIRSLVVYPVRDDADLPGLSA